MFPFFCPWDTIIPVSEPEIHRLTIEKIVSRGAGMGRLDGRVVFVPYTLPGEEVEVALEKGGRDFAHARLSRVLVPSEERVEPVCPHFTICGGCDFQHMDYRSQGKIKKEIFREALRRIGGVRLEADGEEGSGIPFVESPPLGYRNRAQVHRTGDGNWGFKMAGSHRVVEVPFCPVASPEINLFFAGRFPEKPPQDHGRTVLFGAEGELCVRRDRDIEVRLLEKRLRLSTDCFFQGNLVMLRRLLADVFQGFSGDFALDLYGGVGTFGVFLADRFNRVLSVEENPVAAAYARENLPRGKGEVFSGSVERWLAAPGGRRGFPRGAGPDLVVVDPPRSGLSPPVRDFLLRERPPALIYLSCDAATLARDAAILLAGSYEMTDWTVYDFYPQTSHLEVLCRFAASS